MTLNYIVTNRVVCNQLGFELDRVANVGEFPEGDGQIWLDDLGSESSLSTCSHSGWGNHNCSHSEDVGVICIGNLEIGDTKFGSIKSNQIIKYEVVIEAYYPLIAFESCESNYDTWLYWYDSNKNIITSCDDCNDYGCECENREDLKIKHVNPGTYYFGIGGWSDTYGDYIIGAFVDNTEQGTLRLSQGSNEYEGRLEVFYNLEWGTVCDDSFDVNDGKVVCNQLGLDFDKVLSNSDSRFGNYAESRNIWMDDLGCSGGESRLDECSFSDWAAHNCGHHEEIYLRCKGKLSQHETKVGAIIPYEIIYYRIDFTEDQPWVAFEPCGSNFDTDVYFYDSNMNQVSSCDDCNNFGAECGV